MNRKGHIRVPNWNPYAVYIEPGKRYDAAEAFQRSKRGPGRKKRRAKKFLYETFGRPGATIRQKVVLKKTRSVFDCIRISKWWAK